MRRLFDVALLASIMLESTGCYSWHQEASPYPRFQVAKPTDRYRITLADGRSVEVTNLRIQHDSLIAMADSVTVARGETQYVPHPMAVPLAQVSRVQRRAANAVVVASILVGTAVISGVLLGEAAGKAAIACIAKKPC